MTTTSARIEANLRNSQRSTGPRTRLGKARSRLNAITHGLSGEILVLPGEDTQAYQRRLDAWTDEAAPCNAFEQDLVRQAVGFSWRLDRADRVQAAMLAEQIASAPIEEERRRREEIEDLGRRLLPPPRQPVLTCRFGVWIDMDRLALPTSPDDLDDPFRLVNRLQSTAGGCRWLLDHWAVLRPIVDGGKAWPQAEMVQAIRLLGKQPLEAADDRQVLTIVLACFALDPERPDPFAALWEMLTQREVEYYRNRLLGRGLRAAMPPSKEQARAVLLAIVDATVGRLERLEAQHRVREAALLATQPARLSFDDSPQGEFIRRQQGKFTRGMLRIVGRLRDARRRGEVLVAPAEAPASAGPAVPAGDRTASGQAPASDDREEPVGPGGSEPPARPVEPVEAGGSAQPAGLPIPTSSPIPAPAPIPAPVPITAPVPASALRPNVRRWRVSPARAERIAIRAIQWLATLGLTLLVVAAVRRAEGSPPSGRPEVSVVVMQPMVPGGSPGQPWPGLSGLESPLTPVNRGVQDQNEQNEPKLIAILPVVWLRVGRRSDRSRGPPGRGVDPSSAAHRYSKPPEGRAVAAPRAGDGDGAADGAGAMTSRNSGS